MSDDKLYLKLKKLLALADRGVGGEKETASRMLEKMLKKHGISMEDLTDEKLTFRTVKYSTLFEKSLIHQIMGKVTNTTEPEVYRKPRTRSSLLIKVTDAQYMEFLIHWEALKPDLQKAMKTTYSAFVQVNKIFPKTDERPAKTESVDPDEEMALRMMMMGMSRTAINQRIGHEKERLT